MIAQTPNIAAKPHSTFTPANGLQACIPAAAPVEEEEENVGLGSVVEVGAGATTGCVVLIDDDDCDDDVGVDVGTEEVVEMDGEVEVVTAAEAGFFVDFGTQLATVVPL